MAPWLRAGGVEHAIEAGNSENIRLLQSPWPIDIRTASGVWDRCLQMAGIAVLWLADLNIVWVLPHSKSILGSRDRWEFTPFNKATDSPFARHWMANVCR